LIPSKEKFVHRLFDTITPRYDLFNRIGSLGMDRGWRRTTIRSLQLKPEMRVLDLASGTGDLARDCAAELVPLGTVVACDLSLPMLSRAVKRLASFPPARWHLRYAQGKAEQLPFPEKTYDAATMAFALRNVSDLDATFREYHRVMKPGARLALLEFGRPTNFFVRVGHWIWLSTAIPLFGFLTTGLFWPFIYLRRSILQFMPPEQVVDKLRTAGFSALSATRLSGGIVVLYQAVR
jgi:demethylmenaquinone methyltransferase/2-methoxy-6-polyprenyl-1,4-benzoquinol methylase